MLGNIGSNTCFYLYGNALWVYAAMVPVVEHVQSCCCAAE